MKRIVFASLVLMMISDGYVLAQTTELDLLKQKIAEHPQHDTTRLELLVDYMMNATNTNTSQALPYIREIVDLSQEIGHQRGIQLGYLYLQIFYSDRGDFATSQAYADTVIGLLSVDTSQYARVKMGYLYNNLGGDYFKMGDYTAAIEHYTESAKILEGLQRTEPLASVYDGLSAVYEELGRFNEVREFDRKAIDAAERSNNHALLGRRLLNHAERLLKQGHYDEAELVVKRADPLVKETRDLISEALLHQSVGAISQHKGLHQKAISEFKAAYQIGVDNDDKYQQVAMLDPLVKSLLAAQLWDDARRYNDTLLHKATIYKISFGRKNAFANASEWYRQHNDYKTAYEFLEKQTSLADSISSDEVKKKIALIEVRYKVEGQNREIQILTEEKKVQDLQIRNTNILNYILIGSTISLLIMAALVYRNYKARQALQQQRIVELETEKQLAATEAILKGEEQERSRLAKDLHDGLGGMLSGVKFSLSSVKENLVLTNADAQSLEHSIHMLDSSISEMRRVAHNLMPESLVKFGLSEALSDFCKEISSSGMLKVTFQPLGLNGVSIDRGLTVTTYRIVQELLNNSVKHAHATEAVVQVSVAGQQLAITVEDDGKGVEMSELQTKNGIGWKNIRSRVDYHKGTINVQSSPGKGTSVFIEFPIA